MDIHLNDFCEGGFSGEDCRPALNSEKSSSLSSIVDCSQGGPESLFVPLLIVVSVLNLFQIYQRMSEVTSSNSALNVLLRLVCGNYVICPFPTSFFHGCPKIFSCQKFNVSKQMYPLFLSRAYLE